MKKFNRCPNCFAMYDSGGDTLSIYKCDRCDNEYCEQCNNYSTLHKCKDGETAHYSQCHNIGFTKTKEEKRLEEKAERKKKWW